MSHSSRASITMVVLDDWYVCPIMKSILSSRCNGPLARKAFSLFRYMAAVESKAPFRSRMYVKICLRILRSIASGSDRSNSVELREQ